MRDSDSTTRRPRLLFINRSYWPEVEATGQLLTELCEDLAAEFAITVICGPARKVSGDVPADADKLTEHRGVRIRRIRHTQFDKASFAGRLINILTFQAAATWSALTSPRSDVVIVETDPPLLCLLGRALQLVRRTRLVCYLQDIYPDVAVALGKLRTGMLSKALRNVFFRIYRQSDAVVVLSRDMRNLLAEGGVPAERIHVVPNWVDTQAVRPMKAGNRFRAAHGLADKFVVMYSGNLGMSQDLPRVLKAAELLRGNGQIVFVFVGDGAERKNLERIAQERRLGNVRFFDYQPKAELATSLSAADLHLVVLRPEIRQLLMPSKVYGALASGTPILLLAAPDCELAQMVRDHDLGAVVSGSTPRELAMAIELMASRPDALRRQAASARAFSEAHCSRAGSVDALRDLFRTLAGRTDERVPGPAPFEPRGEATVSVP